MVDSFKDIIKEIKEEVLSSKCNLEVYARVIPVSNTEGDENTIYLQVSLQTEKTAFLNADFFSSNENFSKDYHPYVFEFLSSCSRRAYEEYYRKIEGKWVRAELTERGKKRTRKNVLSGNVVLCASPIVRKSKCLCLYKSGIKKEIRDALEKPVEFILYANNNLDKINDVYIRDFCDKLDPSRLFSSIIYNVGQGNFIEMSFGDRTNCRHTVLFDVGITVEENIKMDDNDCENEYIKENIEHFNKINPETIILSHWDIDHILGVVYVNAWVEDSNIIWIAPDYTDMLNVTKTKQNNVTQSAIILLAYLLKTGKKVYLANKRGKLVCKSSDDKIKIWQGDGKSGCFTKTNNIGLVIELSLDDTHGEMLFPGDCEYSHMPQECVHSYDFMVASHHAAKQNIPQNLKAASSGAICVCSLGENSYRHPSMKFIQNIREQGFMVEFTGCIKKYMISYSCNAGCSFSSDPKTCCSLLGRFCEFHFR